MLIFQNLLYETPIASDGTPFSLDWGGFLLCLLIAVVIGCVIAATYRFAVHTCGRSVMTTLILLPPMICALVPFCNNNIGIGLAVAGVFGLVRFRSFPGTARDIGVVFLSAVCGIICGAGYVGVSGICAIVGCAITFFASRTKQDDGQERDRDLRIVIPESLDYVGTFDDLFEEYTEEHKLIKVKTTNLGAMYELSFTVRLKNPVAEKAFLDAIRERNGNLTVISSVILPPGNEQF